jgi:hypothetical protein
MKVISTLLQLFKPSAGERLLKGFGENHAFAAY